MYLHFIRSLDQSPSGSEAEEASDDEEVEVFINPPVPSPTIRPPAPP